MPNPKYLNPNLNVDYFTNIDTKSKAYFLGFIFADGNIRKDYRQLKFNQDISEISILKKFCNEINANPSKINIKNKLARLWISRRKIVMELVKLGAHPNKSLIIELPQLDSRLFYLSFLLGYYDGDGKTRSTIITSGSRKFLQQIKTHFSLPFKLRIEQRITWHDNHTRSSQSTSYELSLGAELFREMMHNYADSLPSKRKYED
jgi:hypothetical protein